MSKKLLSVAIAVAVAAPMAAQAEIKLSGAIQAEIGSIELNGGDSVTMNDKGTGAIAGGGPNKVKLAFSEDLGGGLKAFGQVDWAFDTSGSRDLTDREQFVGLKGSSGAYFRMGRIQGAYKTSTKIDPFYSTAGQMRVGGGEASGAFANGSFLNNVAELGFKGGGFKVALQGIFDEADGQDGSMLADVEYSNDMFTVYGAYSQNEAAPENANQNWKIGAKAGFGGLGLGLQYEDAEMNSSLITDAGEYITGSLTYGLGNVVLAGWVSQFTGDNGAADAMSYAAGGVYQFSKKTFVYAAYTSLDRDIDGSDMGDLSGFAAGVRHSF